MAVYHATRQRTGLLGAVTTARTAITNPGYVPERSARTRTGTGAATAAGVASSTLPRRRARVAVRAGARRDGRLGLILGGIVVAFLLAFFSLAQTVRVSATGYDIDRLIVERERLDAQRQELLSDLNRLGREPAIRKQAIDVGLAPLVSPIVVTPR
jgi:hypothetical protein